MTRRVPELNASQPRAQIFMNAVDAAARGLARNDVAVIESRRGSVKAVVEIGGRNRMPQGTVFVPWFDEGVPINKVTLDSTCPISKEIDFKKCAVRVIQGLNGEDEMKKFHVPVFVSIALSLAQLCLGRPRTGRRCCGTRPARRSRPTAVPDAAIGLAAGTAFEQPAQAPIAFNSVDPGESELRRRPNADFPPVIPHSVEDIDPISQTENPCLDCHGPEAAMYSDAAAVPPSHQVDLRRSPDSQGDEVVGARWVCTSCHVAQTDAAPSGRNRTTG